MIGSNVNFAEAEAKAVTSAEAVCFISKMGDPDPCFNQISKFGLTGSYALLSLFKG